MNKMGDASAEASASSKFECMLERPPTPPRDCSKGVDDALHFLQNGHEDIVLAPSPVQPKLSVDTPLQSPNLPGLHASTAGKKVGFSTEHIYHDLPQLGQSSSPSNRAVRRTPLARTVRPLRSILKPSHGQIPPSPADLESSLNCFSPQEPGSFRRMLNSALQHLGQPSRSARLDAYLALNGALKVSDGMPDPESIVDKGDLLAQFLARDMAWKDAAGQIDRDIVTQALHLASAIIFNQRTAPALDEDFKSFLLDRSLVVLEQAEMPKAVIKGHMLLLCQFRLHQSAMTAGRAERLVSALQTIQDRCSGQSIVPARLIVYQRLLEHVPAVMLNRMRDWIEHVFHALLSSAKEIRLRALEACTTAGLKFGTHPQASKVLNELCEKKVEEGLTYGHFLNHKLMQMVGDAESAPFVPQVWASIILLYRCKRRPLERWQYLKVWLSTLQKCLNAGDILVKQQAHLAWNKLLFAIMPDSSTSVAFRSMLKVPVVAGLKVRGNDKNAYQQRSLAMDSYCNLLHYALRPELSHEELDLAWNLYVDAVLGSMSSSSSRFQQYACSVLQGLFQRKDGAWNANAANEPKPIKPEELPRLDPKWLRSRFRNVMDLLEPILISTMMLPITADRGSSRAWRLLISSVAEAGNQEVKISNELKEVMARLTNFFRRLWDVQPKSCDESILSLWITRYQSLLQTTVEILGVGHFTQDFLAMTSTDEVEATLTPSNRPSKHSATLHCAFAVLLALYQHATPAMCSNPTYQQSPAVYLRFMTDSKKSRAGALSLLQQSIQVCNQVSATSRSSDASAQVWAAVAQCATKTLTTGTVTSPASANQQTGSITHATLQIFREGRKMESLGSDAALQLLRATLDFTERHGGKGAVVLGVLEPLAKLLLDDVVAIPLDSLIRFGCALLSGIVWPHNRQALDQGRKALGIISLELPRMAAFDPFVDIYAFIVIVMERAYDHAEIPALLPELMNSVFSVLKCCPSAMLAMALRKTSGGIATWVKDKNHKVFDMAERSTNSSAPSKTVIQFWSNVLQLIQSMSPTDMLLLQSLEALLIAGLSSPNQNVVSITLHFWNSTFGAQETVACPAAIQTLLQSLERLDRELPSHAAVSMDPIAANLPDAGTSSGPKVAPMFATDAALTTRVTDLIRNPEIENVLIRQHLAGRSLESSSGQSSPSRNQTRTHAARLRHDDSQIVFEPIAPSCQSVEAKSQLMTEHQKEVKARQQEHAQIFPEMSSSPLRSVDRDERSVAKRLNFSIEQKPINEAGPPGTPAGFADSHIASDDLPSSPTPRATNIAVMTQLDDQDDDEERFTDSELPSSPPREGERSMAGPSLHFASDQVIQTLAVSEGDAWAGPVAEQYENDTIKDDVEEPEAAVGSDLPSDTTLPAEQLHRETAVAERRASVVQTDSSVAEGTDEEIAKTRPSPEVEQPSNGSQPPEESFCTDSGTKDLGEPKGEIDGRQISSPQTGKKRKRASGTIHTTRKRKRQSPLKRFFSNILGQSQQDDEDNIADEIVVASIRSPTSHLPENDAQKPDDSAPEDDELKARSSVEDTTTRSTGPSKRRRGRPRKNITNDTPVTSPPRGLKRSASAISIDTVESSNISASGKETSESTEARKQHEGQNKKLAIATQQFDDMRPATRSTRRSMSAVLVPCEEIRSFSTLIMSTDQDASDIDEHANVNDQGKSSSKNVSPAKRLADEQAVAMLNRPIAQPKSLLKRLRGMLTECKNMFLGSQEEREFDDVLFEMRREIHEAGRRGRVERD